MGMFDTITCKYSLPMPEDTKGYTGSTTFQTKDLELALQEYEIREDGSFWIEERETEYVSGDPKSKSVLGRLGHIKTLKSWWEPCKITQTIEMYNYKQSDEDQYDYSIEYEVVLVDGKVSNIKLIEFETIENKTRKENDKIFYQKMKKRLNFEKKFYYKVFFKPYNRLIKFLFSNFSKLLNFLQYNMWKIERKITI